MWSRSDLLNSFLKDNSQIREKISLNARRFAENNFDIEEIGKRFNKLINQKFLFENKPKIAVAVSGGPDSLSLAFLAKCFSLVNNLSFY